MPKNLIVLPDGTEIFSGSARGHAIISCTYTQCVNDSTELTIGSVCASELEISLFAQTGAITVDTGAEMTYYKVMDTGERVKVGLFAVENPTRTGTGTYKMLAYDRIHRLNRDLTDWLAKLTDWPYTVETFADMVCEACGLTLKHDAVLPNSDYPIQAFSASGVTGRQILQWLGQIACRFVRATADGEVEFAWYRDKGKIVPSSGKGAYFGGTLKYEEYTTKPIEKVQIQANEDDVGTIYPTGVEEESNTYKITGNPLLTADSGTALTAVAEEIYQQLQGVQYTPCTVSMQADMDISAGDILTVCPPGNISLTMYVMTKKQSGQKDTLECTGSYSRDSVSAVNDLTVKSLNGKVLNLRKDVDGLKVENADMLGNLSSINLNLDGITATVQSQADNITAVQQNITELQQDSEGLKLSVEKVQTDGVSQVRTEKGFSFNDDGLTISQSGTGMENRLDETGMYVTRNTETILQANSTGVIATDVTVRNYLIIGQHARFEDYESDRTACFWI